MLYAIRGPRRVLSLQATIPHLTRSSLHRCLKRHAISRLPEIAGDKVAKKPFKRYPIGYFHLDIAEVRTEEGKLYLFVAIDRTSKFVFAQLHEAANVKSAVGFLQALIEAVPYTIHIVLTDNGIQFGDMPSRRTGPTARYRLAKPPDRYKMAERTQIQLKAVTHIFSRNTCRFTELVLDDDGAGTDLHEAQPAGFDEAIVKAVLRDAEALQHLFFRTNSLCGHNGPTPLATAISRRPWLAPRLETDAGKPSGKRGQ